MCVHDKNNKNEKMLRTESTVYSNIYMHQSGLKRKLYIIVPIVSNPFYFHPRQKIILIRAKLCHVISENQYY